VKTVSEKTWELRPAMAMLTPTYDFPELLDDIPPPVPCKVKETTSQEMKI
jgi:hypothetical protein